MKTKTDVNFTTVAGIKAYCIQKYEQGGHWIIECWTDEDIATFIRHRLNGKEVRRDICKLIKEYEADYKERLGW